MQKYSFVKCFKFNSKEQAIGAFGFIITVLLLNGCALLKKQELPEVKNYTAFSSNYVEPRNVEVLLPPGYDPAKKYDVLYMQDGQNVFNKLTAFGGSEWCIDETTSKLINEQKIRPLIVVASWCTGSRFLEYMPGKPESAVNEEMLLEGKSAKTLSDKYLKFLVNELKPFIDKNFSTYGSPDHTYIMGSSMGGLISCYAVCEYPEIFGGAACLSTHWPALNGVFLKYLKENLPNSKLHKFYFDFGTATLDSLYEPFQKEVDSMMLTRGYNRGKNWITLKFDGAKHNEKDWSARVHIPLEFLFNNNNE